MNIPRFTTEQLDGTLHLSFASNYAYYSIAKNACTFLKTLLCTLELEKASAPREYFPKDQIHESPHRIFIRPSQLSLLSLSQFLGDKSGFDLIVLRDPRKRLASAIRDKLFTHSSVREAIFYRASLSYAPDIVINNNLIYELIARMMDLGPDLHFMPQYDIYSLIERSSPVILVLESPRFYMGLDEFIGKIYGVAVRSKDYCSANPWLSSHSTSAKAPVDPELIEILIKDFYQKDVSLLASQNI